MDGVVNFDELIEGGEFPAKEEVGEFDEIRSQSDEPASPDDPGKGLVVLE